MLHRYAGRLLHVNRKPVNLNFLARISYPLESFFSPPLTGGKSMLKRSSSPHLHLCINWGELTFGKKFYNIPKCRNERVMKGVGDKGVIWVVGPAATQRETWRND